MNIQRQFKQIGVAAILLCLVSALHATTWTVTVSNFAFSPSSLPSVSVGDTVKWVWSSGSHTTTSVSVPTGAATWDSPMNSASTTFLYKVTVPGTYTYKCSMHSSMTGSFTASNTAGIESAGALDFSLNLYPNPVSDHATLKIQSETYTGGEIRLYDMLGKVVFVRTLVLSPGENEFYLTLEVIQKGLYLMELRADGKRTLARKVLKN
ncbi:MAG: T9SS type A sorting domain-containing protein [Bacteroidia bacterium]